MVDVLPGRIWHAGEYAPTEREVTVLLIVGEGGNAFPRRHKESHIGWFRIECTTAGLQFARPIHRLEIGRSSLPPESCLFATRRPDRLLARSQVRQAA